jgi:catecholate siderophore receptor
MSKHVRGQENKTKPEQNELQENRKRQSGAIRATTRGPLTHAAIGIASAVLATGAAAQDGALPQIDVLSDSGQTYQATNQTITRLPTPLRDTPQTINVVTEKVLQERNARTMEEALRSVPGITFQAGEGGQQGDSPIINGFAGRADMFRDGIRDPGWYTRDLFSSDRVEVYKGPASFAFGRGSTGGAINIVSKLPTGASFIDGVVTGSTPKGVRAEVDASGKQGNVAARIAVIGQDIDTPTRDNVWTKRWGVAPGVAIDVTDQTKVTLHYIYQGEESIPDYGHPYLPAPAYSSATGALTNLGYFGTGAPTPPVPIDRSNWFGVVSGPLKDIVDVDTHILTGKVEHDFDNRFKLSNVTRYIAVDRFARPTAPRSLGTNTNSTTIPANFPVNLMTIGRQHFQTETDNTLLVNQTDVVGKFKTGFVEHAAVGGIEVARETRFQQRARGLEANNLCGPTILACRTSLAFPVDTAFGGTFVGYNPATESESKSVAVYASDQMKLNQYFELLGALRCDHFNVVWDDPGNATPSARHLERTDDVLSWRVGGVVHPTPNSSVYVVYGTSFNPAAEFGTLSSSPTNNASVTLDPEENTTLEVGVKVDLLQNRLSVTAAVFRTEKTNLRIPNDPSLPTAQQFLVLDGLARVDGVEVGVAGNITEQWAIFAGYSHLESEIAKTTNLAELGRRLPNTPTDNFTLWTTYAVTPAWTIGGGAIYQSDTFVNTTNVAYVPEYWRFDAMTSYKVDKNNTIQLNIYNIGDEQYYAQYYQGHAVPASGRWASLSWRVRFEPEAAVAPIKTAGVR